MLLFAQLCAKLVACDAEHCAEVVPLHAQLMRKSLQNRVLHEIAQILRKKCHSAKTLHRIPYPEYNILVGGPWPKNRGYGYMRMREGLGYWGKGMGMRKV